MSQPQRSPTTLSIALCTYNGAAYLHQQWESLLIQERQPDEVIICDDGSTDGTPTLLYQLAADAPFNVKVITNPVRLGFNKNFEQALNQCTGDLIFICDQDDYWLPQKLRVMTHYMDTHPAIEVAFNNAWIANKNLHKEDILFWNKLRFDEVARQRWTAGKAMDVLLEGPRVMGCATVVRRRLLAVLAPIPQTLPRYNYDGWISLVGAALNRVHFVNEPLQLYRIHANQSIGLRERAPASYVSLRDRFTRDRRVKLEILIQKKAELEEIQYLLEERIWVQTEGMAQVRQKLAYYAVREGLPANRFWRIRPVWHELKRGSYHRYADAASDWYSPYLAALGDLFE